ncbi:MAG TPA: lysophospholipid acyltransferase family protein [Candidatus Anammoximicrobium sp.]|mgnify:CR=1 FL=1|nr:lysophospholipid acyltransferase family protein [Candidatus Anammoximicrobium sp.]
MVERSRFKRYGYTLARAMCRLVGVTMFQVRCTGHEHVPSEGGVLVCSNHQSYLDPILVGLGFTRHSNYLARDTLFRFGPFGWLIGFVNAIPIDREGGGIRGLKETLKRLKSGEMVLIFPEGTRSRDGNISPVKPGFLVLARRSRVPLLPVALDGAFDAWPRHALLPRPSVIRVCIGEPISPDFAATLNDDQLLAEVESRIRACHAEARRRRLSSRIRT